HDTATPKIDTLPYTTLFRSKARNTLEKNKDIGNWLDKVALVNESLDYLPPSISSVNLDTIQQAVIKDFQIQVIYQSISDPEPRRSEEHTSELQSRENLVCRL